MIRKKKDKLLILGILLIYSGILYIISSCTNDLMSPDDQEPYIYGYAFLDSTAATEGILVRLIQSDDSTYTSANGEFRFYEQPPDTYTVVATFASRDPSYHIVSFPGNQKCKVPNLVLSPMLCTPRDSIPDGYPLGIHFCKDTSFGELAYSSTIGDSLYIVAWEFYQPPFSNVYDYIHADNTDILVMSSLGDREIVPIDRYLGSIPEIWNMGYIIDTIASATPEINNGIVEIEPDGGWVIAKYESYWMKVFVCKSIVVVP